ncbi:hypothetical protein BGZ60DRAFT_529665 [Tricladium varicosporioides]|nr:hypothetical protein BGZ60DRAFT_529665 [Hymenoscyphus varicosporioides]
MDGTLSKNYGSVVRDLGLKTLVADDNIVKDGKMNPSLQHPGPIEGGHDSAISKPSSGNPLHPTTLHESNCQPNIQLLSSFLSPAITATIPTGRTPITQPQSWVAIQDPYQGTKPNNSANEIVKNGMPCEDEEGALNIMGICQDGVVTNSEEDIYNAPRGDITSNSNNGQPPPSAPPYGQLFLERLILTTWFLTTIFLLAMTVHLAGKIDWRSLSFIKAAPINWFAYPLTLTQAKGIDFFASAVLVPGFIAFSNLFYIKVSRRLSHPSNSFIARPEIEEENTNSQPYIITDIWPMLKSEKPRQAWIMALMIVTTLMGSCLCNVIAYQAIPPRLGEGEDEMTYTMAFIPGLLLGSLGSMASASAIAYGLVLHARKPVPSLEASRPLVDIESQSQVQVQTPRAWKMRFFSLPSISVPTIPSSLRLTIPIWKGSATSTNEISETSPLLPSSSATESTPLKPKKKTSYLFPLALPNWNRRQVKLAKAQIRAIPNMDTVPSGEEIATIKGISVSKVVTYIQDHEMAAAAAEVEVHREEISLGEKLTWFRFPRLSWDLWIPRPYRRSILQRKKHQFITTEERDRSSDNVRGKAVEYEETQPLLSNALKNGESSSHNTFKAEILGESSKVEPVIEMMSEVKDDSAPAIIGLPEGQREYQGLLSHHKTKRQIIPRRRWNAFGREVLSDIESDAALLAPDNNLQFEPVTVNERETLLETVYPQQNFSRSQGANWNFSFPWILRGISSPEPSTCHNSEIPGKGKEPIRPHSNPDPLNISTYPAPENVRDSDIGSVVPSQALEKETVQDPQMSLGKRNPSPSPQILNLNKPGESSISPPILNRHIHVPMSSHTSRDFHYQDFSQSKPSFPTDETSLLSYKSTKPPTQTHLTEHKFDQVSEDMLDAWDRWGLGQTSRKGWGWDWSWPRVIDIQTTDPRPYPVKGDRQSINDPLAIQLSSNNPDTHLTGDPPRLEESNPILAVEQTSLSNQGSIDPSSAKAQMRSTIGGKEEDLLDIWETWGQDTNKSWDWNWRRRRLGNSHTPKASPLNPQTLPSLSLDSERTPQPQLLPVKTLLGTSPDFLPNNNKTKEQLLYTPRVSSESRNDPVAQDKNRHQDPETKVPISKPRVHTEMDNMLDIWDSWGHDRKDGSGWGWNWGWPRLVDAKPSRIRGEELGTTNVMDGVQIVTSEESLDLDVDEDRTTQLDNSLVITSPKRQRRQSANTLRLHQISSSGDGSQIQTGKERVLNIPMPQLKSAEVISNPTSENTSTTNSVTRIEVNLTKDFTITGQSSSGGESATIEMPLLKLQPRRNRWGKTLPKVTPSSVGLKETRN